MFEMIKEAEGEGEREREGEGETGRERVYLSMMGI